MQQYLDLGHVIYLIFVRYINSKHIILIQHIILYRYIENKQQQLK